MSYDIFLADAITGEPLVLEQPHQMKGGTYCVGGSAIAELNVTWNYSKHFVRVFPEREGFNGVRTIYGLTGAESVPVLKEAISQLGDDVSPDYWEATEGNAKRSLLQLLALAQLRPDGVWKGD